MGAATFHTVIEAHTSREAFQEALLNDEFQKEEYITIKLPLGEDPWVFSQRLIDTNDQRIDSKWGPAGCIDITKTAYAIGSGARSNSFLFFGWEPT